MTNKHWFSRNSESKASKLPITVSMAENTCFSHLTSTSTDSQIAYASSN